MTGEDATDAELVARTRGGDAAAYAALWQRHSEAARSAARSFTASFEPEDLVTEAFARILALLREGKGPDTAFRAYLVQTVRHLAVDWSRRSTDEVLVGDWERRPSPSVDDSQVEDRSIVLMAFRQLPERWRQVLWCTEIEGMKPRDVAPMLGMTTNAVSALSYRAREGLRERWITAHLAGIRGDETHEWTAQRLGAYARHRLSHRDTVRVERHLDECEGCCRATREALHIDEALPGHTLSVARSHGQDVAES